MVLYQLSPISTITIPRGDSILEHNPILLYISNVWYDTLLLLRYVETNCGKFMSVYQHYRVVSRYVLQHTYLFFLLTLRRSDLPLGKPIPTYPSRHHFTTRVLANQQYSSGTITSRMILYNINIIYEDEIIMHACFILWLQYDAMHQQESRDEIKNNGLKKGRRKIITSTCTTRFSSL